MTGTFHDLGAGTGITTRADRPPDLAPPDACVDLLEGRDLGASIARQVDYRVPERPGWVTGRPSGRPEAELWIRLRGRDPDLASLPLLVDAAAPVVLELGAAWSATVQLTVHLRARPAPGWLKCRVTTRCVVDGVHEEDFDVWDANDVLVAQSRQIALLR